MPGTVHQTENKVYVVNAPENSQFRCSPCQAQWAIREFLENKRMNEANQVS